MRATLLACLLLTTVALPARALACDTECTEARRDRRHAWGSFFSQTGFAIGSAASVAVLESTAWNVERDETAIVLLVPALGGLGMAGGLLAEGGAWDAGLGWGLSGAWPGAVLGASVGVASAMLGAPGDPHARTGGAMLGVAIGALTGGMAAYLEHADGGHPGALLGGFYAGYFTGLSVGLAGLAMGDGVEAQVAPLLASATGAILGVLIVELLRPGR